MGIKERILLSPFYDFLGKRSFAQSGEDIVADVMLGKKRKGFYIEVGAFHPKLFSNTYLFYKRGWNGVCIEPKPEAKTDFEKVRPRDKFVSLGVGIKKDVLEYYEFDDAAANTFSKKQAEKNINEAKRKLIRKINVAVMPLRDILATCEVPEIIELMSIDVEGMDLEVLESNDWKRYRPKVVICEDLDFEVENIQKSKVTEFLTELGYRIEAKTPYSLIFRDRSN